MGFTITKHITSSSNLPDNLLCLKFVTHFALHTHLLSREWRQSGYSFQRNLEGDLVLNIPEEFVVKHNIDSANLMKVMAVTLVETHASQRSAAKSLGVSENEVGRWLYELDSSYGDNDILEDEGI